MATINLGSIKFNWQGAYNGATSYSVDDVVSYNGSSYICKLASTGNLPTNTTYWDQMSSAGTNGTDLTSTLTTQGDIVYRDASGLARLGAGTSGQVLQTNGTGANPSWGTVSSDMVQVVSATGNGATTQAFDSCFSSTYENYMIIANIAVSGTTAVYMRLQNSSNTELTSDYYGAGRHTNRDSTGTGGSDMGFWNAGEISVQESVTGTSRTNQFIVYVSSPFNSNVMTSVRTLFISYDGTYYRNVNLGAIHEVAQSCAGFRFYTSGQTFNSNSTFKIYGMK